jgi:hypothetical protein
LRDGLIAIGRDPLDSTRIDARLRGDRSTSDNGTHNVGAHR